MPLKRRSAGTSSLTFQIGEVYGRLGLWMDGQPWYRDEVICEAVRNMCPEQFARALELCCGSGRLLEYLAAFYPQSKFTGIDVSERMVELAIANNRKPHNVEVLLGDWINPVCHSKFDVIIVKNSLHLIGDVVGNLRSLHDVAHAKSAFIAVETISPNARANKFVRELFSAADPNHLKRHFFTKATLLNYLRSAKWRVNRVEVLEQFVDVPEWLSIKTQSLHCRMNTEAIFLRVLRNWRRSQKSRRGVAGSMQMEFCEGCIPKRMLRLQMIVRCERGVATCGS